MPRRSRLRSLQLRERLDAWAVLPLDEHIAGPVVGPRVEDFSRQLFIVGDGVGGHGLAQDQVALALEELPYRGLVLDIEPFDAQLDVKLLGQGSCQLEVEPWAIFLGAGIGQVGGVEADDQLSALADAVPGVRGMPVAGWMPSKRRAERHSRAGIDLSQFSRLGELGQRPVDLHQKLRILGPHRQGHVPALARHVLGHEPQAELRMPIQVPGGEVGVQETRRPAGRPESRPGALRAT